ncbi:hypothetical protein [Robbsia sp. KACC 23696]|uniref:hypothetical protein n=1 Tax=Robbsia sp. KACC 23696 TaxID=3149231 RepID=UPI00325AE4D7
MSIRLNFVASIVSLTLSSAAFAQTPAGKSERIRGDIVSFSDSTLTVHRWSGDDVTIKLSDKSALNAVKAIQLSDIKPGSYVGTAAITGPDGKMTAREVLVFPEAAKGTGEGHYAWDLGANSTMTNANVDTVVQSTNGRDLNLSYKGGSNTINVPSGVPVVTPIPATRDDLIKGKKVFVVAMPSQGGTYNAAFIVVEKNGVVPPM